MNDEFSDRMSSLLIEVKKFPALPGVYLMRNEQGGVIYIGKAKNLRARVRSYFNNSDTRSQISFLLRRLHSVENIVTDTEEQAFILERDLITKYKPRYNIRLKDDKAFLSIRIDQNGVWPRLELVRKVVQDGARYFGPYSFSYELRELLDIINRVLPLRTCTDTVFHNRQRPCLEYQIKRCAGPCCLEVDREDYAGWVRQAIAILEGKTSELVEVFNQKMEQASEELRFEDAAELRDRVAILQQFARGQRYLSPGAEDRDVFALCRDEKLATISILKTRLGRLSGNKNYSFDSVEIPDEEVLEAAIVQFYEGGREIPEEIILPLELENRTLIEGLLSERRGSKVVFTVPQRGLKFRLLKLAEVNARQHYTAVFDDDQRLTECAKALAKLCKLRQVPRRIECVDISNLQGSDIVGAIVVFFDGRPVKSDYKRYKISAQGKPDDFAAIGEVVTRRLRRARDEDCMPDLLVIDGGRGQLASACAARDALGVQCEIISLAKERSVRVAKSKTQVKKPERVFLEGAETPIPLDRASELTHFLSRIRDEVHRFVIGYHRSRRTKRVLLSVLDEVPGIGPERKQRLFKEFGSIRSMRNVEAKELARVGRMSIKLAENLLKKLAEEKS